MSIDMDTRYRVEGWPQVAVWIKDYAFDLKEVITEDVDEDGEDIFFTDYEQVTDTSRVIVVMVGDDREHTVDVDELVKIDDDAYCSCCGQIGCGWS